MLLTVYFAPWDINLNRSELRFCCKIGILRNSPGSHQVSSSLIAQGPKLPSQHLASEKPQNFQSFNFAYFHTRYCIILTLTTLRCRITSIEGHNSFEQTRTDARQCARPSNAKNSLAPRCRYLYMRVPTPLSGCEPSDDVNDARHTFIE